MQIQPTKENILSKCRLLLSAYQEGKLGNTKMPEESNPGFTNQDMEERIAYFTLPMALNYQRNSYKLWESALKTYNDRETRTVFEVAKTWKLEIEILRKYLRKYKLALQPNKHIHTWQTICSTVYSKYGSFIGLIQKSNYDYLELKRIIQKEEKKNFPYLSGPKIFNYWSFILREYAKVDLKNTQYIEIAPDTHVTKCSVTLGVITEKESEKLPKQELSNKWRQVLEGSEISPIEMHSPLWFWSRNNFIFKLD